MANSYAFEGLKWGDLNIGTPSGTITWSVDWSGMAAHTGTIDQYQAALDKAMVAWEHAASITFANGPVASGTPDVAISFGNIDGSGGTVGLTSWMYQTGSGSGVYTPEHMTLVFDNAETWSPSTAGGNVDFTSVAMHEMGHVIGLDHTSDSSQIMYAYATGGETLGNGDIYGAQVLYGKDPTDPTVADPGGAADPTSGTGAVAIAHGGGSNVIAAIIGLVLTLLGGISMGAGAAAAALKLGGGTDDHDGDGHDAADGQDGSQHDIHAYDLAEVIPITGVHGDEAHAAAAADLPDDAVHHALFAGL